MEAWEFDMPIGLKLFVAMEVFLCHMPKILTSEFDKSEQKTNLCIKVSCCASGMSVVVMGTEPSEQTGFVI